MKGSGLLLEGWILHFEPLLDTLSLRLDITSFKKMIASLLEVCADLELVDGGGEDLEDQRHRPPGRHNLQGYLAYKKPPPRRTLE